MFWNIIIGLVSYGLQLLLAPKPQNAKPATLDDFQAPTAQEGREIPVLFGTKDLKGPNVVWYGDLKIRAIEGARRYGLFGPKQKLGYRYFLGMHMGLCHGPADVLTRIKVGDKVAWQGRSTGGRITISQPNLFGGNKREGGIAGDLDLEMGAPDQGRNDYLQGPLGADVSAHRGIVGVVLRQMYLGTTAYLKPWEFRLQRIYKRSDGTAQWYAEKAGIGGDVEIGDAAIYFALDVSGSMAGTRLANMKSAVAGVLDAIEQGQAGPLDFRMVAYGPTVATSIERRDIEAAGYDDLSGWLDGLSASGGTSFTAGVSEASTFFSGSSADKRRIVIFVTDGQPDPDPGTNAAAAAATLAGIADVEVFCFNIALSDTQYSELLDNTPSDGVPVVTDGDPSALQEAIAFAFALGIDMNPAHIIRECLTDKAWGMGYNDGDIGDSFEAAADTLFDEGFGLTLEWSREGEIQDFVTMVQSHIDAYVYTSRSTGKFEIKLIRADYDIEALPVIDEDDVVSWDEIRRRQPAEAVNFVIVQHYDRKKSKDASVGFPNIAQIQQTGEIVSTTRSYPGITRGSLAVRVAERDVRSLGAGMADGRLTTKRTIESLNPGDPFRLLSSRHKFAGEVMRAGELRFGDGRRNAIGLKFVQDVFHLGDMALVDTTGGDWENPSSPPVAVSPRLVWEMPWRELVQMAGSVDANALLASDADAGLMQVAGGAPTGDSINAVVAIDAGSGYEDAADEMDFSPAGFLDAALGGTPDDDEATLADASNLEDITVGMLAAIGPTDGFYEIVVVAGVAGSVLTLARGCLDTVPRAHAAGAAVVVFDDFSMSDMEARTATDEIDVKLRTVTGQGDLALEVAPADTVTFASRAGRPYRPAAVSVNSDDGFSGPVNVVGVNPIPVTWARRNRLTEPADAPLAWTDADVTPEEGQTTTVTLTDLAGNVLHSYTGISGTSQDVDPADFGSEDSGYIIVSAVRDGLESLQGYRVQVLVSGTPFEFEDGENYEFEDGATVAFED